MDGQANHYSYDVEPRTREMGANWYHPSYTAGEYPWTSPVGSFGGNGYGLYDMAGNAREWCWDWYGSSYYTTSNGTTDPRGPASGTSRVDRGGSWISDAFGARCANRINNAPGNTSTDVGFRPARSSVP
jgi:formylglycine-generating enzyme required for sulfatase activity